MMYNKVILVGNLSRDVELKYTPNGTAVAKFGLATNRAYKDSVTGENKQEVMFIDVTIFGTNAENAQKFLHKGSRILVEGRLVQNSWVDKNGQKRTKHEIIAEKIMYLSSKQSNNSQTNQSHQSNNSEAIDINEEQIPF